MSLIKERWTYGKYLSYDVDNIAWNLQVKIAHENNIAGILKGKRKQTNSIINSSLPAKHLQKHNTKMRAIRCSTRPRRQTKISSKRKMFLESRFTSWCDFVLLYTLITSDSDAGALRLPVTFVCFALWLVQLIASFCYDWLSIQTCPVQWPSVHDCFIYNAPWQGLPQPGCHMLSGRVLWVFSLDTY